MKISTILKLYAVFALLSTLIMLVGCLFWGTGVLLTLTALCLLLAIVAVCWLLPHYVVLLLRDKGDEKENPPSKKRG